MLYCFFGCFDLKCSQSFIDNEENNCYRVLMIVCFVEFSDGSGTGEKVNTFVDFSLGLFV